MRIVQMIDSLNVGGGERMSVNLANFFQEKGIPNLLISTRMGGKLQPLVENQDQLMIFSKRSTFDFITFFKMVKAIRSFGPTVFHAHDSSIFWAVLLKLFLPRVVLIWHAHYGGFSSTNARFGRKIKYLQLAIDRVIVVNHDLLDWVRSELSKIPKVCYIGNFPEQISDRNVNRDNSKLIISIANLKPPKDHQTLILAFSKFLKNCPGFQLALIGSQDDPIYLKEVLDLIQLENLEKSVQMTGPIVDLKEWFDKAKLGVLSSTTEGLPVSLLELGLSGIPVICTNVGACPDLLENGACGTLIPIKSADALANALTHAVNSKVETSRKADLFYQKVIKSFGGENFFKHYSRLIYSD